MTLRYLAKLNDEEAGVVNSLLKKSRGRPLLLGPDLEVQEYIKALKVAGSVVSTSIVISAGKVIIAATDISLLPSHGGSLTLNNTWAKSLLKRMKYVKRKCSNVGKVAVHKFEYIQDVFLSDIVAEVVMNDIPDSLIINWDHTGLPVVPTGEWTMHQAGDKVIPIAHVDNKH